MPMVSLFAPLTFGLYLTPRGQLPAVLSMLVGLVIWLPDYVGEMGGFASEAYLGAFPVSVAALLASIVTYLITYRFARPVTAGHSEESR